MIENIALKESVKNVSRMDISKELHYKTIALIDEITTCFSPVPSLSFTDEESILCHWICGNTSLEIEINENGPCYLRGKNDNDEVVIVENNSQKIILSGKKIMRYMEEKLEINNPYWKEKYLNRDRIV